MQHLHLRRSTRICNITPSALIKTVWQLFKWDKSVCPSHCRDFMSGCASVSRAVITLCSDGTICSLWRAAAILCPCLKKKKPQNIQMFAGCPSSRRAGINNGVWIQRRNPNWSGGQLCGYHEKTHTSYDRASSGTWRGVGLGFLDECFACTVEPTGRRLFFCVCDTGLVSQFWRTG